MFDKVVYINLNYNEFIDFNGNYNVAKFCADVNDKPNKKGAIALLGINYAKRLIELGKNVAIIVDDIDSIQVVENDLKNEVPILKNLLNCSKVSKNGSATDFTVVPLRFSTLRSVKLPEICKANETLGIVVDNNEIDLFHSYRI